MIAAGRLRRAVRRGTLGVDVSGALNLVGGLTRYLSLTLLFPAALAVGYDEPPWPFLLAGLITATAGFGLEVLTHGKERVGMREGFLVVSLTWLMAAAVGALPLVLSGENQFANPIDAYFEAMSGFTTTGATIATDVEGLDQSVAMWRQFMQWLGGMGIIVLALAVLPRLRVGGRQLFESEAPGPEIEPLAASIRATARRLWLLYVALTAILASILAVLGWTEIDREMDLFEAVSHAFSTMPTGGFSTEARSFEPFAPASQWTVTIFMAIAGANFALMYTAFVRRRPSVLPRDEELRLYLGLLALGTIVLAVELAGEGIHEGEAAVRHAAFQVTSMMTTTGLVSADFNEWTPLAVVGLVGVMFIGGTAGSTAGSVKVVRHLLIGRVLRRELDQTVHPEMVTPIRLNGRPVDERTVRAVIAFVLLYVGLFAVGTLALIVDAAVAGTDLSPFDAIAAVATTLGNVGPGLGFAGPMGSFEPFSNVSKLIMIALMWLGRLELIPVIVIFTRQYWRP